MEKMEGKQQLMVEKGGEEEEVKGRKLDEEEEKKTGLVDVIWEETKKLWIVAGPAILTRCSHFGITIITQAFVGHVGPTHFAALALISTVLVRFANGILLGMASALETLCGQAFGSGQYHMLGIYLQRSWIVLFACSIFILPIFLFTAPLLSCLGQPHNIAAMAGFLSLWFIPIILSYVFSFTLQMYLQAQGRNIIIPYLAAFFTRNPLLPFLVHLCQAPLGRPQRHGFHDPGKLDSRHRSDNVHHLRRLPRYLEGILLVGF